MNQIDKSNYFRGILVLSGKDNRISPEEQNFMDSLGEKIGFEKTFRRSAINSFFQNQYITNDPPLFSSQQIARSFLYDGILLITNDDKINQSEVDWLNKVAETNGINENWLYEMLDFTKQNHPDPTELIPLSLEEFL